MLSFRRFGLFVLRKWVQGHFWMIQNFTAGSREKKNNSTGCDMKSFYMLIVLAAFATEASAQVFKCKGPSGKIVYTDAPCSAERLSSEQLNINPNANTLEAARPRLATRSSEEQSPELSSLMKRNENLMNQSNYLASKGNLTVGEIIKLKQLRAEQKNVQREMMIMRGQDTTNVDNEQKIDDLEKKLRRVERQQNNPVINGRQCTRYGNNLVCP